MRPSEPSVSSVLIGLTLLLSLAACNANSKPDEINTKLTRCTEPRPQVCTHEYLPVCATLQDGARKTYPTGCTACSDSKVVGYVPEPCTNDK